MAESGDKIQEVYGVRVAVEGCVGYHGHGTLDAIYSSVEESCKLKGWSGVDLLIICGDFQACRNMKDLNITAMPPKYRHMQDFHKYYHQEKFAPYLTVFIGGNHEASNHNFELYYGGWAARNIYYLGAANVIQFGPIKIAALSGIWKGYDYRKPHFERLPYDRNEDDQSSIYHVRELDVRKLLAYTSQVDVGLSHDWPKTIERHGNLRDLFSRKPFLQRDSQSGRLGNAAALQVLDRLRPPYWFSAHLHVKFAAIKDFKTQTKKDEAVMQDLDDLTQGQHGSATSLMNNFSNSVQADDTAVVEAVKATSTHRRTNSEGLETDRDFITGHKSWPSQPDREKLKHFDPDAIEIDFSEDESSSKSVAPRDSTKDRLADGSVTCIVRPSANTVAEITERPSCAQLNDINPDALDIDLDELDDIETGDSLVQHVINSSDLSTSGIEQHDLPVVQPEVSKLNKSVKEKDDDIHNLQNMHLQHARMTSRSHLEVDGEQIMNAIPARSLRDPSQNSETCNIRLPENLASAAVPDALRAELESKSTLFRDAPPHITSPALPPPTSIYNKTTNFLALDKCEPGKDFLQLLEIHPVSPLEKSTPNSYTLRYDPEWLSILRAFADELHLGGSPSERVPQHKGETNYAERIAEERKWIEEHIVAPGKLIIPDNWVKTVEREAEKDEEYARNLAMPREQTNPQTKAFCELIDIVCLFDESEEARDARHAAWELTEKTKNPKDAFKQGHRGEQRGRGHGYGGARGRGRERGRPKW